MSTSTDHALLHLLHELPGLDDVPQCEWADPNGTVHGAGEAATGISHLPCPCGFVENNLIGDACTQMIGKLLVKFPDLLMTCMKCKVKQVPLSRATVTPL